MFYKVTPNPAGTKYIKPRFVFVEEIDDTAIMMIKLGANKYFYNGARDVLPAKKDDPEFIAYVNLDVIVVAKEIESKKNLLKQLKGALKQSL